VLAVDLGYDPKNLAPLIVKLDETKYPRGSPQLRAFYEEALTRVKAVPGVKAVATVVGAGIPFTPMVGRTLFSIEGRPPWPAEQRPQVEFSRISPDYFRAMGMQLRAGRGFTEWDNENAPPVVVINETYARLQFPGEDPIGKSVTYRFDGPRRIYGTVVGVAADMKRFGLEAYAPSQEYHSVLQRSPFGDLDLVARTAGDPLKLATAVRQQVWAIDANMPVVDVMSMEQRLAESLAPRRFQMLLFGAFALVALALAAVGVYGVISHSVSRRTHEIGIRMALGAQPRDALLMVIGQGMRLTLAGVAIGLAAALSLTRVMAGLLFNVKATDSATFMSATLLLVIIALIACYIPARRATKVDPLIALKHE
jgi:putative ABC transport system permease protein